MDLDKTKVTIIEKGKSKDFLKFLKEQKEKNEGLREKYREIEIRRNGNG